MRVLVALTYYYPHWTGLTVFAKRLAEGLAAKGHQVTVVTCKYRADLAAEEIHNGVRIVRVPTWFRLSRGQIMPGFLPTMWRLVREHDVVQVHTPMFETWGVGLLSHLAGRGMLMTHHGDLVMPSGAWNQFVQKTVSWLLGRGAAVADAISIYTQDYADHSDFLRPHAAKVVPVYPPFTFPKPDLEAAAAWRRELGLGDAPIVGFAGRFVEEKGFDFLLKAIPLVVAEYPKAKFAYAGEPNVVYESFWERCKPLWDAQREHLVSLGLITNTQRMADYYAMCDVFALPSRTDCLASVQVEAMLCGTPVVATDIPGAREVVRVTGMGVLVEPRSEHALAHGLVRVLGDRARYVKSYEHVSSIFNTAKALSDYEAILEGVAAGEDVRVLTLEAGGEAR